MCEPACSTDGASQRTDFRPEASSTPPKRESSRAGRSLSVREPAPGASTVTWSARSPRATSDERPTHPVTSCALSTNVVRPCNPVPSCSRRDRDDGRAPGPSPGVRARHAAGDRPWLEGGARRDPGTQCRAPRPRRATRRPRPARDRQPSRPRSRSRAAVRSARSSWRSTPATGPAAVSTRTCCASNC